MYIYLYKFFKKYLSIRFTNNNTLILFNKKKNLFFKKKFKLKVLVSKRLSIVLRKRKKYKNIFTSKKISKGNFFFKKFFLKTLFRSRKFLKNFFFLNEKTRQKKISKHVFKTQKYCFFKNSTCEYSALNLLFRSHFCLFISDAFSFFKSGMLFLNGIRLKNPNTLINVSDCLQIKLSNSVYKYIYYTKFFLKKKIALFRHHSWKFFKQKFFKIQDNLRPKKRKSPKYLLFFFLFKVNTPKFLEVDYFSLSIILLKKQDAFVFSSFYLNKLFSFKLFSLYNFKKIN